MLNPECQAGKHRNCDGMSWDNHTERPAPCPCECHDTTEATTTGTLRAAATRIREVAARVEALTIYQPSKLQEAIDEMHAMGFSRAPLALATAAWLEDHAATLDLLSITPDESGAVARYIVEAVAA